MQYSYVKHLIMAFSLYYLCGGRLTREAVKVVVAAYERWSLTRGLVVPTGGSTVFASFSRVSFGKISLNSAML